MLSWGFMPPGLRARLWLRVLAGGIVSESQFQVSDWLGGRWKDAYLGRSAHPDPDARVLAERPAFLAPLAERLRVLAGLSSAGGRKWLLEWARSRMWSTQVSFGLRCRLDDLPPRVPAKIAVVMREERARDFDGFARSAVGATGHMLGALLSRHRRCLDGISTLYVARDEDQQPIHAHWLMGDHPGQTERERAMFRRPLEPGEVILDGALTFPGFEGMGVMGDATNQLLSIARHRGAVTACGYVMPQNTASLRGCARAGLTLDHLLVTRCRLGTRTSRVVPPDAAAFQRWKEATG